jgi:hypothetical protein
LSAALLLLFRFPAIFAGLSRWMAIATWLFASIEFAGSLGCRWVRIYRIRAIVQRRAIGRVFLLCGSSVPTIACGPTVLAIRVCLMLSLRT